jgi:RNA polymerase sigma-70 factor, ECF subfamily
LAVEAFDDFRIRFANSIARFYARSGAAQWNLPETALAEALHRGVHASIRDGTDAQVQAFLDALRGEDLALAIACQLGVEAAWERFIATFRPVLYGAARALARDAVLARELADSLYAELYGLDVREGKRRSLLLYFHGRSSLATWLRAIVAQRYVDFYRRSRPGEPSDDSSLATSTAPDPPEPARARYIESLSDSLNAALRGLAPRDRLRLSYYYLEGLRLNQVGRLMNEHESTVSRRLARTRLMLKRQVERTLRREKHLSEEQIRLCFDYAAQDSPFDLRKALSQEE